MEEFLELFGNLSINFTVKFIIALLFIGGIICGAYCKFKKYVLKNEQKEEQIQICLKQIKQYPKWREQSILKQQEIDDKFEQLKASIEEIKDIQNTSIKHLEEIEANNLKREQNKLRSKLLQWYTYYTRTSTNPMQAWTEMEADSFWQLFKDYEAAGGDGYMHTEVQPKMNTLTKITLDNADKIKELMESRK